MAKRRMRHRARTRGPCCADSAEHSVRRGALFPPAALVTTDAPFAGNVERKVSNHRARFYAADHSWIVRNWRRYHHDVTAIRQCNRFAAAAPQIRYRGISDVSLRFESYPPRERILGPCYQPADR